VWRRPDEEPATPTTVCPGEHTFADAGGPYTCVWWDPRALDLGVEPGIGLRRESLIMKGVPGAAAADGDREYSKWRTRREEAIAFGSAPSLLLRTATEWAQTQDAGQATLPRAAGRSPEPSEQPGLFDEPATATPRSGGEAPGHDVAVVDARGPERPGGKRFGELVHAMLASAPLDADRAALEALAEVHGRILSAPVEELAAAVQTGERVLAHALLARARAALGRGACRRETPVTCLLSDGVMVEGIVDLAFEEQGAWTVVDYKTDRELAASGEDRYRRQVALYASAIAQASGQPATGVLIRL
jgi:ATP-dependent exoDNAse (exonuclease V) beta subunit